MPFLFSKVAFISTLLLSSFFTPGSSQTPDWKFPIAFEDATGAKDTIFYIWDSSATSPGLDPSLGEVPLSMPTNVFQVYMKYGPDSIKTFAIPPSYLGIGLPVYATNYVYPITIRWDTTLFVAPQFPFSPHLICQARIDNDYFFLMNNDPPLQAYNMLLNDTADCPPFGWGGQEHFPMNIDISRNNPPCPTGIIEYSKYSPYNIYPIPTNIGFYIECEDSYTSVASLALFSLDGKLIIKNEMRNKKMYFDMGMVERGIYFLQIKNNKNKTYYEKIIKY